MRISRACLDYKVMWVIDNMIGGLYSIDLDTFETKCVVSFWELFQYGKFAVECLLKWKDDYILIIPREINRSWICYNKLTGEIEYRKVIERRCQEVFIAVDESSDQICFCPQSIHDPILTVNLNTLTCSLLIDSWGKSVPCDCSGVIWKGAYNGEYIFFPIRNTRVLVRMDCRTQELILLDIEIEEGLFDVDYAFGELWLLPASGNKIYQVDVNGAIINTVELILAQDKVSVLPDFARIVIQKKYLFLLPYNRKGIFIYDKQKEKTIIVSEGNMDLENKDKEPYLGYWEYCVRHNQICFFPYMDKYIEIDLDNLMSKKKDIFYPKTWSVDKKQSLMRIWNYVYDQEDILRENANQKLELFLKYVQYKTNKERYSKNVHVGKIVLDLLIKGFL